MLLAEAGLQTTAIDISPTAIDLMNTAAQSRGVSIASIAAPVDEVLSNSDARYDVIVVSRFLDRVLLKQLPEILKPDGLLFYQTFVKEKVSQSIGPSNPGFLLDANELLELGNELRVRLYFDLGSLGDTSKGLRNESCLIAQKCIV